MAYDPNDPADKAIVDGLISEAIKERDEQHETEIAGLKAKNTELLDRLKKAREGGENSGEVDRLERELDEVRGKLNKAEADNRQAQRDKEKAERAAATAEADRAKENEFSRSLLIENGLTAALKEANVADELAAGAKALLGKDVSVKDAGDGKRELFVGDKSLGDYVKEWAASDAGKVYVKAPVNGGGGANNGTGQGGGSKKLSEMTEAERIEMAKTNPAGWDALLKAEGSNLAM